MDRLSLRGEQTVPGGPDATMAQEGAERRATNHLTQEMATDKLTAERVHHTVMACLYPDEELPTDGSPPPGLVEVSGVVSRFGFDPARLEAQRASINEMLDELPESFAQGMSFLNACNTKTGELWGQHRDMDSLFCLGMAIGRVGLCFQRDLWSILPGGMPYYIVKPAEAQ